MKKRQWPFLSLLVLALGVAGCGTQQGEEGGGLLGGAAVEEAPPRVTLPAGTEFEVRLITGLDSEDNKAGDTFQATLEDPVVHENKVVFSKGAEVIGHVTKAVPSGRLKQRAELWVTLDSVTARGRTYQLATTTTGHKEGSKVARDILFIGGGAGTGAAIGGAAGGGKGAGIGAAIGAGAGTAAAMLTGKRNIKFPPETVLRFRLEEAVQVTLPRGR